MTPERLGELLIEARVLIASAAHSIPKGTFAADLWVPDARAWTERANTALRARIAQGGDNE